MKQKNSCSGLVAVLLFILAIILLFMRNYIFNSILASLLVLSPNSPIINAWLENKLPTTIDFYLFNWTNPEEIYDLSSKPKFQELGPYAFNVKSRKVNVTWNANNTVTFNQHHLYFFDEKKSRGKLTDQITTLNTITLSMAHIMRDWNYFAKRGFSLSLGVLAPDIHITKSADELLFGGYQDPHLDIVRTFLGDNKLAGDKAGFFYGMNNSYTKTGVFNVANGVDGNTGQLYNWNYRNETPQGEGSCVKLHGTVGDFFPRGHQDSITAYLEFACRTFKLDYEKSVVVKNINGDRYTAQQSLLDNGTIIPENNCFCNGECVPSGMMNLTTCAKGAPLFMSLPHFYGADPVYLSTVDGLQPERSKHEIYLDVEPEVGISLQMALRVQVNFLLHPIAHITSYDKVPKLFFPVVWMDEKALIQDDTAWEIRLFLSTPTLILPLVSVGLIIVGILLLLKHRTFFNNFIKLKVIGADPRSVKKTLLGSDELELRPFIPIK